jgi:hypothetical protein
MWIFTNFGFFSIVQNYENAERLVVRARSKGDLQALITNHGNDLGVTLKDIDTNDTSDYRYRIHVDRPKWAIVMMKITNDIDYTNFKDSVHSKMGKERAGLCSHVWSVMYTLQDKEKRDDTFRVLKVR